MDTLQILMGYTSIDISTGRIPCFGYDKDTNRDRFIDILFRNTLKHYSPGSIGVTCIGKSYSYFNITNSTYLESLDVYKKGYILFINDNIVDIIKTAVSTIENNKRVISYLFIDFDCVTAKEMEEVLDVCKCASSHKEIRIILTVQTDTVPAFEEHDIYRDYYITETQERLCVITRDYWGDLVRDIF